MKKIASLVLLSCVLLSQTQAGAPPFKMPKEYRVDMVSSGGGHGSTSTMYVNGSNVRVEANAGGQKSVTIIREDQNKAYTLMPAQKMYMEMAIPKEMMRMTPSSAPDATWKKLGSETVNGQKCEKYQCITREGGHTGEATYWVSKSTKMPVRMTSAGHTTDWKNFKAGKQDPSLFQPPAGYSKMSLPGF